MILNINNQKVDVQFNTGKFVDIAEFKKRYEPELGMTLDKYMRLLASGDYELNALCDLIYYPYVIERRAKGLPISLTMGDIFTHFITNKEVLNELKDEMAASMPQPEQDETGSATKKKVIKK